MNFGREVRFTYSLTDGDGIMPWGFPQLKTQETSILEELKNISTITSMVVKKQKPSKEEVLNYACPIVKLFISKHACDIPREQKDEILQAAYLRLLEAYEGLDPDAGWKAYVYNHCRGTVLDYQKFGKGFYEEKWSIAKEEQFGAKHIGKINQRVFNSLSDDTEVDIDHILGSNGIFSDAGFDNIKIKWDLVSRMARQDPAIHALAKWIRGFPMEEIGEVLGLSRARAGQLVVECLSRFAIGKISVSDLCKVLGLDSDEKGNPTLFSLPQAPEKPADNDPWFRQTCFAFGLCKVIGLPDQDQSEIYKIKIGWNIEPVDLDSNDPIRPMEVEITQIGIFDGL